MLEFFSFYFSILFVFHKDGKIQVSHAGELNILEIYTSLCVPYLSVKSLPLDKDEGKVFFFKKKKIAILLERKNLRVL